jgi:hypothetical protein
MKPEAILRIAMPRQIKRASIGLHLAGPMPSIRDLQRQHGLRKSAACWWHVKLAKARREFCHPQKANP